jgi:hypothetical protein
MATWRTVLVGPSARGREMWKMVRKEKKVRLTKTEELKTMRAGTMEIMKEATTTTAWRRERRTSMRAMKRTMRTNGRARQATT